MTEPTNAVRVNEPPISKLTQEPVAKPSEGSTDWTKNARKASSVNSESELKEFLDSVTVKDFNSQWRSASPLNRQVFQIFRGRFEGQTLFDDRTQKNWDVVMILRRSGPDGDIRTRSEVTLSKDGKVFSKTSGDGNLLEDEKNFKSIPGVKNAILVNAQGNDVYFQLFYFPQLNQYSGIVYLDKKIEGLKRVGTVNLQKIN